MVFVHLEKAGIVLQCCCIFDRISFRSKYSFNFLALISALKDGKLFGIALLVLHKIVVYRHFSYFQYGFQNGHQRSRDYYYYYYWFHCLAQARY